MDSIPSSYVFVQISSKVLGLLMTMAAFTGYSLLRSWFPEDKEKDSVKDGDAKKENRPQFVGVLVTDDEK